MTVSSEHLDTASHFLHKLAMTESTPPTPKEILDAFCLALEQSGGCVDIEKLIADTSTFLEPDEHELLKLDLEHAARRYIVKKSLESNGR